VKVGVAALFLLSIVGCSSEPERETSPAPKVSDATDVPAAAHPAESSSPPGAIDDPFESPPATAPTQRSDEPLNRVLRDPLAEACPFPATACTGPCVPLTGARFDDANQCLSSEVVVGCLLGRSQINTDLVCFKRSRDGVILGTSRSLRDKLGPDWESCTVDEMDALRNGAVCR
jgi:hypothetical protein